MKYVQNNVSAGRDFWMDDKNKTAISIMTFY